MNKKKKVLLAFSGGLDTSYCAIWLAKDQGYEVHTAAINTGGFDESEEQALAEKADNLGIKNHVMLNVEDEFYQKGIRYLIFGNVLKNHTYPLSVSAERVFQAVALAEYAKEIGADAIAHGSTGAGNDQVRFDLVFQVMAPDLEIITPIRDQKLSREEEVEYLKSHGIEQEWAKAKYSINKGLWGTSVGGAETLSSHKGLPEDAWPTEFVNPDPLVVELGFEQGEPVTINGERLTPVEVIKKLNELAAPYGIGRDIHVGDTIIGIKGRVGFEAAAPIIIIKAHQLLEKHTLGKWQLYWKDQLAEWYGMLMHEGQYLDPVMRNIETFLEDTQKTVSGNVFVKLEPKRFELEGIESENDLMGSKAGQYGEMNNAWSGEDVKGFTKILANSMLIQQKIQNHD
ncbi:argininosuccinate synthase [Gracilimonas sediminicola]|uniref:argininosuccinate synthase n=1 Tax=Gracilimonas sediminicola TaxID=2952158 RepID=A0A9X2RGJ0_9BACT|nr:argininosuccinate synthase [Gracilimonas sediminicola]MCP9291553.1 argininosuccinate synthase [Gracilimonas sediminicola]